MLLGLQPVEMALRVALWREGRAMMMNTVEIGDSPGRAEGYPWWR